MDDRTGTEEPAEIAILRIERDICALFHRYAESADYLEMPEFDVLYTLPYWEYLDRAELKPSRRVFVSEGCLMLILRLVRECPRDGGPAQRERLRLCRAAIAKVLQGAGLSADRPRRLAQFALLVIDAAERGEGLKESELDEIAALEDSILGEYFARRAKRFAQ